MALKEWVSRVVLTAPTPRPPGPDVTLPIAVPAVLILFPSAIRFRRRSMLRECVRPELLPVTVIAVLLLTLLTDPHPPEQTFKLRAGARLREARLRPPLVANPPRQPLRRKRPVRTELDVSVPPGRIQLPNSPAPSPKLLLPSSGVTIPLITLLHGFVYMLMATAAAPFPAAPRSLPDVDVSPLELYVVMETSAVVVSIVVVTCPTLLGSPKTVTATAAPFSSSAPKKHDHLAIGPSVLMLVPVRVMTLGPRTVKVRLVRRILWARNLRSPYLQLRLCLIPVTQLPTQLILAGCFPARLRHTDGQRSGRVMFVARRTALILALCAFNSRHLVVLVVSQVLLISRLAS